MRGRIRRIAAAPIVCTWRSFTGKELDGVPRTDAAWFTPGAAELDPDSAPRPPETLLAEIRRGLRSFRIEWREMRVRRKLSREWRDTERWILAEHDHDADSK